MRDLVAPAEAIFLDAKFEAELVELGDDDEAREMLAEMGIDEPGLDVAGPGRVRHPRAADLPDRRPQGVARLDDPQGRDRPRGRRRHPHRLPAGLHQGRGRLLRRPGRGRVDAKRQGGRQGAHGGQGLRHGRRRRGRVPLQRLIRRRGRTAARRTRSAGLWSRARRARARSPGAAELRRRRAGLGLPAPHFGDDESVPLGVDRVRHQSPGGPPPHLDCSTMVSVRRTGPGSREPR